MPGGGNTTASASDAGDGTIDVELDGKRSLATVARRASELTGFAGGRSYRLEFEQLVAMEEEGPTGRLVSPLPASVIQGLVDTGGAVPKSQPPIVSETPK